MMCRPAARRPPSRLIARVGLGLSILAGLAGDARASEPAATASPVSWHGRGQSAPLRYRFRAGQTFAYRVEFTHSIGGSAAFSERLSGTPYIQVQSVSQDGEAELFIIGKLECSAGDESEGGRRPHKDVWLGSRRITRPNGGSLGKADVNTKALPGYFKLLALHPREFILPPLLETVPSVDSSDGSAMMFATVGSSPGISVISTTAYDGRLKKVRQADVLRWPLVRLIDNRSFETKPGQKLRVRIDYRSTGTFDANLGLLRELDMSYREEHSGGLPIVAGAKVRLIEGEALKAAYKVATEAWAERPAGLSPVEFKRVRADPFLPQHLGSVAEASPGATLYHLRGTNQDLPDADNRYYVVQVIGPGKKGTVAIQYQGSNEALDVSPGTLAFPISAQHPGRGRRLPARKKA